MRSVGFIRFAKIANLVMAVCLFAFGITLIASPNMDISVVRIAAGVMMALFGIFKMAGYFSKDLYRLAFQYDLPLGIVFILIGTVMLARTLWAAESICAIFGLALIIDSIFKVIVARDARKFGLKSWSVLLGLALLACATGTALLFCPTDSQRLWLILFGVACIADGLLNFIEKIFMVKVIRNQREDEPEEDLF